MANYFIIKDKAQLDEVVDYLMQCEGIIALDTETTKADAFDCILMGLSISAAHEEAFYIPLNSFNGTELVHSGAYFENKVKILLNTWLKQDVKLLMHNSTFDIWVIRNCLGIDLLPKLFCDTLLLKHTVDEMRPHGLKPTLVKYLGEGWDQGQLDLKENVLAKGGKWLKDTKDMWMGDIDILGRYAAMDADGTRQLFYTLETMLVEDGLQDFFYKDEVMPLNEVVIDHMLKHGIYVDVEYFKNLKKECEANILRLEKETEEGLKEELGINFEVFENQILDKEVPLTPRGDISKDLLDVCGVPVFKDKDGNKLYGIKAVKTMFEDYPDNNILKWKLGMISNEELIDLERPIVEKVRRKAYARKTGSNVVINLNSSQHLSEVLFNFLGEEPSATTATGSAKTDKDTLEKYRDKYKFITAFLDKKKEEKLVSTYINNILALQKEGIVRPSWLQAGTDSGRFSCAGGMNFMNLPRDDKRIKKGVIARPGHSMIVDDYSQLEARVFAAVGNEPDLIQSFFDGQDFWGTLAVGVYDLDCTANEVKKLFPEKRQYAKCFLAGTKIRTDTGYKSIENIVIGDKVATRNGFKLVTSLTTRESSVGVFATNRGFLGCTDDHKIFSKSKNDWVEASKFEEGSEIITNEGISEIREKYQTLPIYSTASLKNGFSNHLADLIFNEDWAYVLGAFLGNGLGSYNNRQSVRKRGHNSNLVSGYVGICGLEEDLILNKWKNILQTYGWKGSHKLDPRKSTNKTFGVFKIHDFQLTSIFQNTLKAFHVMNNEKCHKNLKIQDFVFNSPLEVKLAFIAGLLDTNGYLKINKTKKKADIVISSKSFQLMSDLGSLLQSIGIEYTTFLDWNTTYQKYYYLLRFSARGIRTAHSLGIQRYLVCPRKVEAVNTYIKARKDSRNKKPPLFKKFIPIKGKSTVYDITVEEDHEFYAHDILVHNCFGLAAVYGALKWKIAKILNIEVDEAEIILKKYFKSYPNLKKLVDRSHGQALSLGYVQTLAGRKRRLTGIDKLQKSRDKDDKKMLGNLLNISVNFQIQSLGASIINRAMINIKRELDNKRLPAFICMQVHDELVVECEKGFEEEVSEIVQRCMENSFDIGVPLEAKPIIVEVLSEAK